MLITKEKNARFEEIRKYVPVSVANEFEDIQPFTVAAEVDHLEPLLGSALYGHLSEFYANPDLTAEWLGENKTLWEHLLNLVQRAIVNLAYWKGFDMLSITADSAGFHREETDSRKTLFRYQEENLKAGFRNNGFNALDKILTFLESNSQVFPEFKTSPSYTIRKTAIVPGTDEFNKIYFIDDSRLVFLRFQPFISQVEDFTIRSVLGNTLFAKLREELAKEEPDPRMKDLLAYLRNPVVFLAVAKGLSEIGINITDRAVFLESQGTNPDNHLVHTPAADTKITELIRSAKQAGEQYLEVLKSYLASDPEKWPEYSGQVGSVYTRDNTDKKTIWV